MFPTVVFNGLQDYSYDFTEMVSGMLYIKYSKFSTVSKEITICLKSYETRQNVTYLDVKKTNDPSEVITSKEDVVYTSPIVTISYPGKFVDYNIQLEASVPNSFKAGDYCVRTVIEVTLLTSDNKTRCFKHEIPIVSKKKVGGKFELYKSRKISMCRKPSIYNAFNAFSSGEVECMVSMDKKECNPGDLIDITMACSSKSGTPLKSMDSEYVQRTYFNSYHDLRTFGQIEHKAKNVSRNKRISSKVRGLLEMQNKLNTRDCFKYKLVVPSNIVDVRTENNLNHHHHSMVCLRITPRCWFGEYEGTILFTEGDVYETPEERFTTTPPTPSNDG